MPLATNTTITMLDGAVLAVHRWIPDAAPDAAPRGTIVIAHGLGEHARRYGQLAHELSNDGWTVWAPDHRGHGRSSGARGTIPTATAIRDDLLEALALARSAQAGPVVLLGHSMGGAFAAWAIAHAPTAADALILSSPALRADLSIGQRLLMHTMRRLAPNLTVGNGLDVTGISHDQRVIEAYTADPLVHDRVSPRLAYAITIAGETVRTAAPDWRTPTLLLYAGADRLVNPQGSADFAASAPRDIVTTRCFDGLYHELFNEPERDAPVSAVREWLGLRLPR